MALLLSPHWPPRDSLLTVNPTSRVNGSVKDDCGGHGSVGSGSAAAGVMAPSLATTAPFLLISDHLALIEHNRIIGGGG